MTDTFTPNLGLTKQSTGSNNQVWGDVLNDGFIGLADDAIAGRTDIDVTAGNVQLTSTPGAPDQARAMFLMISAGTPGTTRDVIVPTLDKGYLVHNDVGDGSDVVFRTALGTGVTVPDGTRTQLYVDAVNNIVREVGLAVGGGGSTVAPMEAGTPVPSVVVDNNGTGGRFPTVISVFQGNSAAFYWTAISSVSPVVVNSTSFIIEPILGTYFNTPLLRDFSSVLYVTENGSLVEAFVTVRADGTALEYFRADGGLWIFGSTRFMRTFSGIVTYGLTGL